MHTPSRAVYLCFPPSYAARPSPKPAEDKMFAKHSELQQQRNVRMLLCSSACPFLLPSFSASTNEPRRRLHVSRVAVACVTSPTNSVLPYFPSSPTNLLPSLLSPDITYDLRQSLCTAPHRTVTEYSAPASLLNVLHTSWGDTVAPPMLHTNRDQQYFCKGTPLHTMLAFQCASCRHTPTKRVPPAEGLQIVESIALLDIKRSARASYTHAWRTCSSAALHTASLSRVGGRKLIAPTYLYRAKGSLSTGRSRNATPQCACQVADSPTWCIFLCFSESIRADPGENHPRIRWSRDRTSSLFLRGLNVRHAPQVNKRVCSAFQHG